MPQWRVAGGTLVGRGEIWPDEIGNAKVGA
jgi:hypothetical protein